MLTRRAFVRTLALAASGLLLPAPVAALAEEPARRLWALDGTMLGATPRLVTARDMAEAARFAEAVSRVLALIQDGVAGIEALGHFRAPSLGAVDHFEIVDMPDPFQPFRPYSRRITLMSARSRPSYLRRTA
jgi:hypothetical protein